MQDGGSRRPSGLLPELRAWAPSAEATAAAERSSRPFCPAPCSLLREGTAAALRLLQLACLFFAPFPGQTVSLSPITHQQGLTEPTVCRAWREPSGHILVAPAAWRETRLRQAHVGPQKNLAALTG